MSFPIASRQDRVRAGVIDALLFLPLVVLDQYVAAANWDSAPHFVYFLASMQLGWVYTVLFHGWRGQTVGKMIMRIRVVRHEDRERLGWGRAIVRELPYIVLVWANSLVWGLWNLAYVAELNPQVIVPWAEQLFNLLGYAGVAWMVAEFVTMSFHPERRAIHDLLAGSVVVKEVVPVQSSEVPDTGREPG